MRYLLLALMCAGLAMAFDPDAGVVHFGTVPEVQNRADITITVLNDYTLSFGQSLRGVDYIDYWTEVLITDYGTDRIYSVDPNSGTVSYEMEIPPEVPDVLGICTHDLPDDNRIYINDWGSVMDIYRWSAAGGGWEPAFPNPVPSEPRGLDMDEFDWMWSVDAATRILYRFDDTGGSVSSFALSGAPSSYACACAVFPYGASQGILIGGYSWGSFYIYEYDGAAVTLLGSVPEPMSTGASYGVGYSHDRDSFFWVWRNGASAYHLTEFAMTIETALQSSSWGEIKASF